MAETLKASAALDVFSQNQGAILYRGPDGWQALESPGEGYALVTDDQGYPTWVLGGGSLPYEDSGWVTPTLINGWTQGTGMNLLRYRRNAAGMVSIQGTPYGGSEGSVIFNLPEGFRPLYTVVLPGAHWSEPLRLFVYPDGRVLFHEGYEPEPYLYCHFQLD